MFMNIYIISEAILRVPFFKCAKQFFTTHHKSISLIAAFLMFRWEIIIKLPIKSFSTMIYYLQLGPFLNNILTCFSYSKYYQRYFLFLGNIYIDQWVISKHRYLVYMNIVLNHYKCCSFHFRCWYQQPTLLQIKK